MLGHSLTVVVDTSLLAPVRPHGIRLVRLDDDGESRLTSGDTMFKHRGVLDNAAPQQRLATDAHPDCQSRTPSEPLQPSPASRIPLPRRPSANEGALEGRLPNDLSWSHTQGPPGVCRLDRRACAHSELSS